MDRSLALSLVIGATVGAGLRSAVGATITHIGQLGKAVEDAEQRKAAALRETARLDQTARQMRDYRTLGREVLAAGVAHRAAQEKVHGLAREIAATEAPTKAQQRALEEARRAVVRSAEAADAKKRRLAALRGELKAAGLDTRDLGAAERKLATDLADARAKADQASHSITRLGDSMARAGKRKEIGAEIRTEALKIGAAYLAISAPIKAEGDFEHHLRAFGNTAGMTADQLEDVRTKLRGMSTEVNQSTDTLLGGVEALVGKGLDAKQAMVAIKDIGRAATATGASVEDMSNLSYSVLSNLHVPVDKLGAVLDSLAQSGKEGGFELKDMAREFPALTASASALGLTGTEAVASLGAALQVAMKGASDPSTAANNLANFLAKVASPETAKNFEKLGIDIKQSLADGVAGGENPIEVVMKELADATGNDLTQAMEGAFDANGKMIDGAAEQIAGRFKLGEVFGDRQVQDFLAPMLANYGEYLRIKQKAAGASGVVDKDFAAMSSTFNESAGKLGLAWDKLMGSVGKSILPAATAAINVISDAVDAVADLADAAPLVTKDLIEVVGGFIAFKSAMLVGRYAMTFYRGGVGGVVREMLGLNRASATATGGLGRVGTGSAGAAGKLGLATTRLRQYAAAATSAAGASSRLARAQGGIGGLDDLGLGGKGKGGVLGKLGRSGKLGRVGRLLGAGEGVLAKVGGSGIAKVGGKLLGKAALPLALGLDAVNLASSASEGDAKGIGGSIGSMGGTLAGAAAGAAIGSVVPIVGTAIGGIVGGIVGSFGGEAIGQWVGGLFGNDKADAKVQEEKNKDKEEVSSAKDEAAKDGGAAPSSTAPSSAQFGAVTINIYPTPGQDSRAIGQDVARELEARGRAALHD